MPLSLKRVAIGGFIDNCLPQSVRSWQSLYDISAEGVILRAHPGSSASYGALKGKKTASVGYEEERRSAREDWVDQVA